MPSRRRFLKTGSLAAASLALPACGGTHCEQNFQAFKPGKVKRALVVWFSQTGNTQRVGRLTAAVWRTRGIQVDESEIRGFDPADCQGYDLIAVGAPVNHFDSPPSIISWLNRLPDLGGAPVAVFITHGLPPGNQHNTGCALLEALADKEGVPVGLAKFGNLGTYPPAWAFDPEKTLATVGHPNEETYDRMREFAAQSLARAESGQPISFTREWTVDDIKKYILAPWLSKMVHDEHYIDPERCIRCGTCAAKCPTGAIDPYKGEVNKSLCIDCMGCVNNCPNQAVRLVYWGKELVGYFDFLKQHNIEIPEPRELSPLISPVPGRGWQGIHG
jgi:ferredoxin/flavodoxin